MKTSDQIIAQNKIYTNNRYKTDINFRLICKTRCRNYKTLKSMTKQSSSIIILGIVVDTYRKWIEFQFTSQMNWSNMEIHHVKPTCMCDVSDDEQLKEAFSWKNTHTLLKHDHQQKGIKLILLDYQVQFIKAYKFIKLNEEGFN